MNHSAGGSPNREMTEGASSARTRSDVSHQNLNLEA